MSALQLTCPLVALRLGRVKRTVFTNDIQVRGSLTQLALVRRAAGPPHRPLQAACLVVVEVPQPAACLNRVRRQADRCRSPAWPSFNELFLHMTCKFEGRWLFPASLACVQFEAAPLRSVALPPFPSKRDSHSVNESNDSYTQAEPPLPP